MCGIAGELRFDGLNVDPGGIEKMALSVAHRGPDGQGTWVEGTVGLAHRRLAIIDLSDSAAQPMSSACGRFIIVFNGEIYNYRELRSEMVRQGKRFRTNSDTEVLLELFSQLGVAAFQRLNGMFAAGIWDRSSRKLTLVRDRYGIKPLYLHVSGSAIYFASEQRAITGRLPHLQNALDEEALFEYFTFQNIFTDRTLTSGVRMLPAGCFVSVATNHGKGEMRTTRFWDFSFGSADDYKTSRHEAEEELSFLIAQAVERQLVSDVEVGCYLSGGIDSGTVCSIASSLRPGLKSFTCGFDLSSASGIEMSFDERTQAEAMSAHFGTEQYEVVLKAGDMQRAMRSVAWHIEEPRVGQSYPNYYSSKLASRFVKVVLSGAGGDELFGGYPWRYFRAAGALTFNNYVDSYYKFWQRMLTDQEREALFAPIWSKVSHVCTRSIFRSIYQDCNKAVLKPADSINLSLYFECKTFLHGLLVVDDKLGMAHGLETRYPFLDNNVVDFSMRCPVGFKLNNVAQAASMDENVPGDKPARYFERTSEGKRILRDSARRYIPRNAIDAKKQGFSGPDASWFRGNSINYVRELILSPNARIRQVLDGAVIDRLVGEHLRGDVNRRLFIWSLLSFEHWLEIQDAANRQAA